MKNIGKRIRKEREKLGYPLTEFASKIGISKQNLYKYEVGIITNIPLDNLTKIAKALNCSPAYLMGWENEEPACDKGYTREKQLGVNMQQARIRAGMTKQQVAEFLAISRDTLEDVEAGKLLVSESLLDHFCQVVNCTKEDLRIPAWAFSLEGYPPYLDELPEEIDLQSEQALLVDYRKLNHIGKDKAREYVNDLTENEKYTENSSDSTDNPAI